MAGKFYIRICQGDHVDRVINISEKIFFCRKILIRICQKWSCRSSSKHLRKIFIFLAGNISFVGIFWRENINTSDPDLWLAIPTAADNAGPNAVLPLCFNANTCSDNFSLHSYEKILRKFLKIWKFYIFFYLLLILFYIIKILFFYVLLCF